MSDFLNKKIGLLLFSDKGKNKYGTTLWLGNCACGKKVSRPTGDINRAIKNGAVLSCGCYIYNKRKEVEGKLHCYKCKTYKPTDCFSRMKGGRQLSCKPCAKKWKEENNAWLLPKRREAWAKNSAILNKKRKDYYLKNKESIKIKVHNWSALNPEKRKKNALNWVKKNAAYCCERSRLRQAKIKEATPAWSEKDKTLAIYEQAMERRGNGENVSVDHIVPLKSKTVCGLHVPWNLRIIDATENMKKSNKWWPNEVAYDPR